MDEITEIVGKAINVVSMVDRFDPDKLQLALVRLRKLADELREIAPDHPSLIDLDEYLSRGPP